MVNYFPMELTKPETQRWLMTNSMEKRCRGLKGCRNKQLDGFTRNFCTEFFITVYSTQFKLATGLKSKYEQ